ncbi:hypothetical protein Tco_1329767 [Tanacetum coccineum]
MDELARDSDEEEVFAAGDDMEEDTQVDEEEHQSPSPNKNQPEPSHSLTTQESDSGSSSPDLKKFDNIHPVTESQLIKYLKKLLKDIKDAVKDDPVNKKVIEATEAYTKNSSALTELLNLVQNIDFQGLKSLVESLQAAALGQDEYLASWHSKVSPQPPQAVYHKQHLISLDCQQMLEGKNVIQADTEEPPSYIEGEHVAMEDDKAEEEPIRAVPISTVRPSLTDPILEIPTLEVQTITTIISTSQPEPYVPQREGMEIATNDQLEIQTKLVPILKEVCPNPDALILVPYEINGNFFQLTEEQIQARMDKEEHIKKAVKEAKIFEMTRVEVIKVVQEEVKKIGLDPKTIKSAKAGDKFKKA